MKAFVLSAGIALGIALLWLLHESQDRPATLLLAPRAPVVARPGDPGHRTTERPAPPPVLAAAGAPVRAAPPPARAGEGDESEIAVDEQRAYLQARFSAERVDPAWASTSQQALHDDLGRFASNDVQLRGVECRSSLCRVALVLTRPEAGSQFLEAWLHQRVWTGPGFAATQKPGTGGDPGSGMVLFVGRPGVDLAYAQ